MGKQSKKKRNQQTNVKLPIEMFGTHEFCKFNLEEVRPSFGAHRVTDFTKIIERQSFQTVLRQCSERFHTPGFTYIQRTPANQKLYAYLQHFILTLRETINGTGKNIESFYASGVIIQFRTLFCICSSDHSVEDVSLYIREFIRTIPQELQSGMDDKVEAVALDVE